MASQEPPYVAIAQRKQDALAAAIPVEWRLPAHLIPTGMLSPAESITEGPKQYSKVNVMEIPRTCGILTAKELEITEKYDVRGLVAAMTGGKLKAEEVIRGFCKVSTTKGIFVNSTRHTNVFLESSHCSSTYPLYHRTSLRSSTASSKGTG